MPHPRILAGLCAGAIAASLLVTVSPADAAAATSVIAGTVRDETGTVVTQVKVKAYDAATGRAVDVRTRTYAGGHYHLRLPAGTYKIRFSRIGSGPADKSDLGAEWYGNATSRASSADVAAVAGRTTHGVDATVDSVSEVAGRFTLDGTKPTYSSPNSIKTFLHDAEGNLIQGSRLGTTFEYPDLADGTYELYVRPAKPGTDFFKPLRKTFEVRASAGDIRVVLDLQSTNG